MNTSVN